MESIIKGESWLKISSCVRTASLPLVKKICSWTIMSFVNISLHMTPGPWWSCTRAWRLPTTSRCASASSSLMNRWRSQIFLVNKSAAIFKLRYGGQGVYDTFKFFFFINSQLQTSYYFQRSYLRVAPGTPWWPTRSPSTCTSRPPSSSSAGSLLPSRKQLLSHKVKRPEEISQAKMLNLIFLKNKSDYTNFKLLIWVVGHITLISMLKVHVVWLGFL